MVIWAHLAKMLLAALAGMLLGEWLVELAEKHGPRGPRR